MHRNSQKRIIEPNKIYAITTVTNDRYPYFENEILSYLLITEIKLTKIIFGFKIRAFCILYDHLHLMIMPKDKERNTSKIMQYLKRNFTRNANYVMGNNNEDKSRNINVSKGIFNNLNEGDNHDCRLPQGCCIDLEEYQKILIKMYRYIEKLKIQYQNKNNFLPYFKWQKSFHDHIIRGKRDFYAHYKYITQNYKKHGNESEEKNLYHYPENYKFTSIKFEEMVENYFVY